MAVAQLFADGRYVANATHIAFDGCSGTVQFSSMIQRSAPREKVPSQRQFVYPTESQLVIPCGLLGIVPPDPSESCVSQDDRCCFWSDVRAAVGMDELNNAMVSRPIEHDFSISDDDWTFVDEDSTLKPSCATATEAMQPITRRPGATTFNFEAVTGDDCETWTLLQDSNLSATSDESGDESSQVALKSRRLSRGIWGSDLG